MFLRYISAFSLVIPFIISIIRYKKLDKRFIPFVWVIWFGMTTEVASILLTKFGYSNNWLTNIYILVEGLLLFELFRRWQLFSHYRWFYMTILCLAISGWIMEWYIRESIYPPFSIFIIYSSFIIVLSAQQGIITVLFKEPTDVLKNPIILLSTGFVLFFAVAILAEIFWFHGIRKSSFFRINIYEIFQYVNLITNFIYAYAILWIPLNRRYLLQLRSPV
jgi:hypothetical protein